MSGTQTPWPSPIFKTCPWPTATAADKLLIADVVDDRLVAVPRGVMAAAGIMQGGRGGIDGVTSREATRIKNHLAKYYKKMDDTPPWED